MNKIKKFYTAKYDRVFKAILCKEENNILFKAVLSHALQRNVKEFKFLNP